ncbi:MAG: peptidase C14 caspase catalytic subunit p20 [Bacteroidetes bacterium]|nr:MAG: peptidase C14 caspase catalytic subunit p20 [Bacteroidota bacterium]
MKEFIFLSLILLFTLNLNAQSECVQGNCYNGYGTCVFPSGAKYIGDFKNGKLHGKGIFYFSDGNKYLGNWVNQYREGKGRMIFKSGDEYFGEFKKNKFSGEGVMIYANGNRYEGTWTENKPAGYGIFVFVTGDRYEGNFLAGLYSGQGTMFYSDGSRYEGEWEENKRHGQGLMHYPDGETVFGQWENDQYLADWSTMTFEGDTSTMRNCNEVYCDTGVGKFRYKDGSRYIGEFFKGSPEGRGTLFYANGDRYEGGWKQHAPHGRGVMYYKSGKVVGAIWDFGKPVKKLFSEAANNKPAVVEIEQDREVKIWAVIIGAARYTHMPVLRYTDDDAYQIYAFLKSPEGGALPDEQLRLLIDEDATHENIMTSMRSTFLRADENDVIMFYFSGHGLEGAFLSIDYDGYNNRLEHTEITQMLKASRAKHKIVLADACHSGSILAAKTNMSEALRRYYEAFEATRGGTALLMSSKGEEYSLEDGGLRSGIFSHFLVRGLKGEADNDSNSIITIEELFRFIHKNVRRYTGNIQTPTLTGDYDSRMPVGIVREK